jgi:peptide/nickel transport system permease protein
MRSTDQGNGSVPFSKPQAAGTSEGTELSSSNRAEKTRSILQSIWRMARFFLFRTFSILAIVFVGVFITIMISEQLHPPDSPGGVDASINLEVNGDPNHALPPNFFLSHKLTLEQKILFTKTYEGLSLPFLPRHLLWTGRAMVFNLGRDVRRLGYNGPIYGSPKASAVILSALPNTLLLVGTAFLLLLLAGIPLSLYLFRKHGSRLDRFLTLLAPLSSIPSWVLGMILVLIFAVGMHLLPASGMLGPAQPHLSWNTAPQLLLHLILPVGAIFLSLFFQLIYTWKTFFLSFAGEDYVELAKAKGIPEKQLEKKYIVRPTVTYIITSFALLMATFWQTAIALEYVFNWPGVGRLFISTLPNLVKYANTDAAPPYYGVTVIVVEIVVLFAYILGVTTLVLDVVYALVDPRFRIGIEEPTVRGTASHQWNFLRRNRAKEINQPWKERKKLSPGLTRKSTSLSFSESIKKVSTSLASFKPVLRELGHFPSAVFGLVIILLLVCGSAVAVTAFPYKTLGKVWYETELTGQVSVPRLAKPVWLNFFLRQKLPPSFFLDSSKGQAEKTVEVSETGEGERILITYILDYPYVNFPSDMRLYFTSTYSVKRPFAILKWFTPDGREMVLDNLSPETSLPYNFVTDLKPDQFLSNFPHWQDWYIHANDSSTSQATPPFYLLFADPSASKAVALPGTYRLQLEISTFEANSNVDAELNILGQTYGFAGTDYLRRDLLVPLLWGMPFALALGLIGASLTTVVSMFLSAAGVFFGGRFDQAIQRIIEGVMMLPVIAIGVILFISSNMSIWLFLGIIALLNVFGSPTKSFRAALLQIKDSPYIEWARASGASNYHIIMNYFMPNILPMLAPQLVALIPSYVFLEATLGIFGVKSQYPTWGRVIYDALRYGGLFGSSYWVFEPIALLLLTGLAFAMLGFALERILNPRLRNR